MSAVNPASAGGSWETPPQLPPGPLELLVIQPTPFCNLDCSYCYLPDRLSRRRIAPEVLELVFQRVFASGLVQRPFTVIWHAGEPLVLPPSFYEQAFELAGKYNQAGVPMSQSFQTNATLIDLDWCAYFQDHDVRLGVSVDGPAFLHDRCRRTRSGEGTHHRVVEGIRLLHRHKIPFSTITVLTDAALDYPDELYEFYCQEGIQRVGFNVEEIEGPNRSSSLQGGGIRERFARFLGRFFDLVDGGSWSMEVREFCALDALRHGPPPGPPHTQETTPFAILNVDCEGRFSTFSPELLGMSSEHYGDFFLGRVQEQTIESVVASAKYRAMERDVAAGVRRCQQTCPYFNWCGGGAPANKYFENGSFDSTETMFCRLTKQAVLDVLVVKLEVRAAALS